MRDPGELAVVIPTRDRPGVLDQTLAALGRQTVAGFEVLVVVDGEDQPVPRRDGVRVEVQAHAGPGAARNRGAAATGRRLVLFLGDDMVPTPGLVEAHLRAHARHADPTDAVLGKVEWHPAVERNRIVRWLERSRSQFDFPPDDADEAGWGRFYSCNVSLDRQWFLDGGGFDEAFVFDYEDLDCGLRLGRRGMTLWYEPAALVHHLHEQRWSGLLARYASKAAGERRFCAKHPDREPFFAARVEVAAAAAPVPGWQAFVADRLADRPFPGTDRAALVVDRWFHQRVGVPFLATWDDAADSPTRSPAVLTSLVSPAVRPGDRVWVVGGSAAPQLVRRLERLAVKVVDGPPADVVVLPDVDALADDAFARAVDGTRAVVAAASWHGASRLLARARRAGLREWRRGVDGVAVRFTGGKGSRLPLVAFAPRPAVVATR